MAVRRMLGGERTSLTGAKIQTESTSMFFNTFITSMPVIVKDVSMCLYHGNCLRIYITGMGCIWFLHFESA